MAKICYAKKISITNESFQKSISNIYVIFSYFQISFYQLCHKSIIKTLALYFSKFTCIIMNKHQCYNT